MLGPETFTRGPGAPLEELRTFSLAEPGAICLLVDNQGTGSARIELDGIALVTPNRLNPHIRQLTVTANVDAGSHDLSVKLASSPGSEIVIEVRFAQADITPTGLVVGDKGKVAVWGLADTPDPFSPANHNGIKDVTTLSAVAQVLRLDGAPGFLYGLHYVFQVTDSATCRQIQTLSGYLPLDPAVHLAGIPISAQWDGRNGSGDPVPDGTYYYRVVVSLVRRNAGGMGHSLDIAASLVQTVTIDSDPQVDEQDLDTLEEVPEEIVQALPPFDVSTPFEVDVPVAETPPEGYEGGNGDRGAWCYLDVCDTDEDGYASDGYVTPSHVTPPDYVCKREEVPAEETGGKALCPDGWVQYTEPHECDQIVTGQDGVDFWDYRVRPDMAEHWLTRFTLAGYWISTYAKHRPHRNDLADNFLDDNCNGLIDETEILYRKKGLMVLVRMETGLIAVSIAAVLAMKREWPVLLRLVAGSSWAPSAWAAYNWVRFGEVLHFGILAGDINRYLTVIAPFCVIGTRELIGLAARAWKRRGNQAEELHPPRDTGASRCFISSCESRLERVDRGHYR